MKNNESSHDLVSFEEQKFISWQFSPVFVRILCDVLGHLLHLRLGITNVLYLSVRQLR